MAVKEYKGPDDKFLESCKRADVKPTMRQRKKWLKRIGSAWAVRHEHGVAGANGIEEAPAKMPVE